MAADTSASPISASGLSPHGTVIVGGGFAGVLLALKLVQAGLEPRPTLIEMKPYAGPGLAYGAARPEHLLNVPVQRMEVGLSPSFLDWLADFPDETAAAVAEAGDLANAFVPRILFGLYLRERIEAALAEGRVRRLRAEVTRIDKSAATDNRYELTFADGRVFTAERVVLATGNLPPGGAHVAGEDSQSLVDSPLYIPDPWSGDGLAGLDPEAPVLLIGTGLTMADIVLSLQAHGHRGAIHVLSRRGLLPLAHVAGGAWPAFPGPEILGDRAAVTPLRLTRRIRAEVRAAVAQNVPWQRVVDAVRPVAAQIWSDWTRAQRAQFLRHLRPFWDVHRHRLAPRIAARLQALIDSGRLIPLSGRLRRFAHRDGCLHIAYAVRRRREIRSLAVARVINCTGPRTDYDCVGAPLFADLRRQGLIHADRLGLGLDTSDARVIDIHGQASGSLYAIGGLTRPAWWEVTAVPEIAAQVTRLAALLVQAADAPPRRSSLAHEFFDLGAGI